MQALRYLYPSLDQQFTRIERFMDTASPEDIRQAMDFCFISSPAKYQDQDIYVITFPRDIFLANLVQAGMIVPWEPAAAPGGDPNPPSMDILWGMDGPLRHALILYFKSTLNATQLLDFFYDVVHKLNSSWVTIPLTPTGAALLSPQREHFAFNVASAWKTYTEHLLDAPWPINTASDGYIRRVKILRLLRSVFTHIAWYYIGTRRFDLARNMLSCAACAVSAPQVKAWKAPDAFEEGGYSIHGIDMFVATVHAF